MRFSEAATEAIGRLTLELFGQFAPNHGEDHLIYSVTAPADRAVDLLREWNRRKAELLADLPESADSFVLSVSIQD